MKTNESNSRNRKKKRRKHEAKVFFVSFCVFASVLALAATMAFVAWDNGFFDKTRKEEAGTEELPGAVTEENDSLEVTVVKDSDIAVETAAENKTDVAASNDLQETPEEETAIEDVTMIFTGDICFYDAYANMGALQNRGGRIESSVDEALLSEMKAADICMVNNEFAYSDRGAPLPGKTYAFRSKPSNVSLLTDMGVDIVSLANNHIYDYGQDALLDTLDILKNEGIGYVGAGRNLSEASDAHIFEIKGRKIAVLSATQVERNANPDTKGATDQTAGVFRCFTEEEFQNLTDAIQKADKEADLTVVYIHWGTENTDVLHWAQTDQAPKMVAAGADLIIGDHPHCLQNIDYIEGVPVIYSLGNFWFNSKTLDTGMMKAVYQKDGTLACQFIPAKQHDCRTDLETGAEKQRILDYMQCISPNVTIDADGYITNKPYDGPEIDYASVERVPEPPATTITVTDPLTGAPLLIDKASGQVLDQTTKQPTGIFVDPATGVRIN